MSEPKATYEHQPGEIAGSIDFLNRTRNELRELRKVRAYSDKLQVIDINGDYFEVTGAGYPDEDVVPLLQHINTNFNPKTIHEPVDEEFKEFKTGRRRAWAEDRVM